MGEIETINTVVSDRGATRTTEQVKEKGTHHTPPRPDDNGQPKAKLQRHPTDKENMTMTTTKRVTARRAIPIADDLWADWLTLAAKRHSTGSDLIRRLMVEEIADARANGELPKAKRKAA